MRRISKPESYVEPKSAARMLRDIANELKKDNSRLVSVRVERKWATKEEVLHSLRKQAEKDGAPVNLNNRDFEGGRTFKR